MRPRTHGRPSRCPGARSRGEPADDREGARLHADADDRALRLPWAALGEGRRRSDVRQPRSRRSRRIRIPQRPRGLNRSDRFRSTSNARCRRRTGTPLCALRGPPAARRPGRLRSRRARRPDAGSRAPVRWPPAPVQVRPAVPRPVAEAVQDGPVPACAAAVQRAGREAETGRRAPGIEEAAVVVAHAAPVRLEDVPDLLRRRPGASRTRSAGAAKPVAIFDRSSSHRVAEFPVKRCRYGSSAGVRNRVEVPHMQRLPGAGNAGS